MKKSRLRIMLALVLSVMMLACGCNAEPAAPEEETVPEAASEADKTESGGTVCVSNVDELLAAIAPDTNICMDDGLYILSNAQGYGHQDGEYYRWVETYDGYELQINNVENLSISGSGADKVTISAIPRYADVLRFNNCSGLELEGFKAGHTELPGECAGGVLYFDRCKNVTVSECALFGCGILGVEVYGCRSVKTCDTEIYDCSYGGVYVNTSRDVLFDNCDIHDCSGWSGLIDVASSSEVAVINSDISRNSTPLFLTSYYSDGVFLGGDTVEYNGFYEGMFAMSGYQAKIDGCSFAYNNTNGNWYLPYDRWNGETEFIYSTDLAGNVLYEDVLENMQLREDVRWEAKWSSKYEINTETMPAPSDDGAVHVSTVDEFLAAIGPDTKIYLEDGEYDLSTATGYGSNSTDYYRWGERFDGPALEIHDVQNLTIMGGGADKVTITAKPRYADVLLFKECAGIRLSGFTAGHTEEPGYCSGGVLYFCLCDATHIESCALYGCGVVGVTGDFCEGMEIAATEIYDCSYAAASLNDCFDVHFEKCNMHDNGEDGNTEIVIYDCHGVYEDGTEITE